MLRRLSCRLAAGVGPPARARHMEALSCRLTVLLCPVILAPSATKTTIRYHSDLSDEHVERFINSVSARRRVTFGGQRGEIIVSIGDPALGRRMRMYVDAAGGSMGTLSSAEPERRGLSRGSGAKPGGCWWMRLRVTLARDQSISPGFSERQGH